MNAQLQESAESTHIVEYGVTDAALAALKEKFKEVPDASTKEGYELIKAGLSEMRPLRTGIELKRVELKADSLAWGRKVDAEAKRITAAIVEIEQPYKDAKQAQDKEEERIKQEAIQKEAKRIEDIENSILNIRVFESNLLTADSATIKERLEKLDTLAIDEENYQEYLDAAEKTVNDVRNNLTAAYEQKLKLEQQEAEQAERQRIMDEQAAEQAKRQAELDAKQAQLDAEEEERTLEAREQQIAKEAAEKAKQEAEQAAAQREQELKEAAERAEREAKETEERLKREAEAAKQKEIAEAEAREKNRKHKAAINNAAIDALVAGGMSQKQAKLAVTLIAKREIPNVVISY